MRKTGGTVFFRWDPLWCDKQTNFFFKLVHRKYPKRVVAPSPGSEMEILFRRRTLRSNQLFSTGAQKIFGPEHRPTTTRKNCRDIGGKSVIYKIYLAPPIRLTVGFTQRHKRCK
jgi:hypothetical protein